MRIELPQTRPYAGLFAVGNRLSAGAVQEIGSVIVKAGYLLTPSGGADTHVMAPDPDPAASVLVLADEGMLGADGFEVTREADIAAYKPLADIAVEGFYDGTIDTGGAEIRVDGVTWLTRDALDPPLDGFFLADRGRHLFGYQPRALTPRNGQAGAPPSDPIPSSPTPADFPLRDTTLLGDIVGYDNRVLNFHRRGGGFSASGSVSTGLAARQRITVRKNGIEVLSVTLSHPPLTALYRTWCGKGPDRAPYWTRVRLGAMRADTLILRPDQGRAEVIWRAIWPWANEPKDSYRAVRVSEGGT